MKLQGKKNLFILFFITLFFLIGLYFLIDYLINLKKNVKENFNQYLNQDKNKNFNYGINDSNTQSVDMPLTNIYSCKNFCSPTSRCAITGQQCFSDIDCPGCQPNTPSYSTTSYKAEVPGNNDAGKLSNLPLQYSSLTSDIGTKSKLFDFNKEFSKAPSANFGTDVWSSKFDIDRKLFDKRYKPSHLNNMSNYPERYSLTGAFIDEGPIASNATLI